MATEPVHINLDQRAVKYTGTNSGEIAALIDDFTVTAESASGLTFTSAGVSRTVPVGGWITYWQGAVRETPFANDDDFRDVYRDMAEDGHVHDVVLTSTPPRMPSEPGNGGNGGQP